jgi:cell wall-associated NlpC family hydrolase
MGRLHHRRLLGALGGVATFLAALSAVAAPNASANPLLDQKQQQYKKVQAQVQALDLRAEALTEQYDHAVWRLQVLHRQIRTSDRQLAAAKVELAHQQWVLSSLLVSQYKGGNPKTMEIVLGASSLSQVTTALDLQGRFNQSVADTVLAIAAAKQAIAHQRVLLLLDRDQVRHQKALIAKKRKQIHRQLVRRRRLVAELGAQVKLLQAADRAGQAKLALDTRKYIQLDERLNASDAGQVLRDQVVLEGLDQIGVPYVWGGASPKGFDCSGLVMWLWAKHGLALPHFAASQFHLGPVVEKGPQLDESKLQIGDLLFFHDLGHVGIYAGNGEVLHAPHTGTFVQLSPISMGWFQSTFVGATQPGGA